MKKLAYVAFASAAALSLAACGSSEDASEDAMADNVEVPADEAMTGVEEPVLDAGATEEPTDAADEAAATTEEAADAAAAAAADVEAAAAAAANGTEAPAE